MSSSSRKSSSPPPGGEAPERGRVWLLEDSPLEARVALDVLGHEWDVVHFADGESLLEKLAEGPGPDVLVLDWTLPGMTGLDVCRFVRGTRDSLSLPILVLTATHGRSDDLVVALASGANDYVVKPYSPTELRGRVRTLVQVRAFHDRAMLAESALRAQRDRFALLARLGEVMGRSLDYSTRLTDLAELLVPTLGNGSIVTLLEPDGRLVRRAGAGWGQQRAESIEHVRALPMPPEVDALLRGVMAARRPAMVHDYCAEVLPLVRYDDPYAMAVRRLGIRGYIAAPLCVGDRVLGVIGVGGNADRAPYTVDDVALVEAVASRAAVAIDNARMFQEAESQRERLNGLFAQAPAAIALLRGPDHVYEIVNAPFLALVGDARPLLGRPVREAQPEIEAQGFAAVLDSVYLTGEPFVARSTPITFDREGNGVMSERCYDFVYQPVRDAGGVVHSVMVVLTDVTEQTQARAQLERARSEAEDATRTKDRFLATVSHEIRTPINSILGWMKLLRSGVLPEERREKALESVERSAVMQSQLVEDLLDVSRITSGTMRIEAAPVNLVVVIDAAVEVVRPAAVAKNIRIESRLDADAAESTGDAARLQQVVWNLLMNAVKFTPRGGRVQVQLDRVDDWAEIVVSDNGAGISTEFLPHVFEVFRQADGTEMHSYGGLGLGLSIVKTLVELHGGTVRATSEGRGQGATFVVRLPLGAADEPRQSFPAFNAGASADCPPELNGLRVLVVDDEPDVRDLLVTVLEQCGALVHAQSSVPPAFDDFVGFRPAVVVSDVGMPGEDGYAFVQRIRALAPHEGGRTPVIALTAYARAGDRARALRSGFDMHVAKPIEPSELLAVIATLATRDVG